MRLTETYLDGRTELLNGMYDEAVAAAVAGLGRLYNHHIGPVTSLSFQRPELLDLSIYGASCAHLAVDQLVTDLTVKVQAMSPRVPGGGKGLEPLAAALGALGEITERITAVLHASAHGVVAYARYRDLAKSGLRALSPEELPIFAAEQYSRPGFPFVPYEPSTYLGWVRGADLLDGQPVLVPAQLVLLYYKRPEKEPPIGFATTAGVSYRPSERQAILHGLYEVVERDGVNVYWYCKIPPPHVSADAAEILRRGGCRMSTPYLGSMHLLHNALDVGIPVFTAIAFDGSRADRAFLGGSGAGMVKEDALRKAVLEVGQGQGAFRFDDPFGRYPIYPDTDIRDIVEFFDAPLYFGYEQNISRTYWYVDNTAEVAWGALPSTRYESEDSEYNDVLDKCRQASIYPVVFKFDDGESGSVVRVFVPDLTMACPPGFPFLGHPRFYDLPERLGLAGRRLGFPDLNQDPIPFA